MSPKHIQTIQKSLFALAILVFMARTVGVFDASIINITSNWLIGRPLLVPALGESSLISGFEDSWLSLIDGLAWCAAVLLVSAAVLFSLPPATEATDKD
ncbi:TPA: hypothetical protein NKO30_005384 [Pseudomonas aeruginosa]|nr:hypothetical protein [Pseudomonas aeruginosa]